MGYDAQNRKHETGSMTMGDEPYQPGDEETSDTPARAALIERSILVLLFVGLLIGVLAVVKPFTTAILFGTALATAAWPARQALVRRGLGRGSAATLLLLLSIVVVALPLLFVAPHLADQMIRGAERVQSYFATAPERPDWIASLPLFGARLATAWAAWSKLRATCTLYWSPIPLMRSSS
jgi:predicted PurR-regulated permease PerM